MNTVKTSTRASFSASLLLNYVFVTALIVLLLNDHYWKLQYANWWTGKLSDLAGLILLPLWLAYLFPRRKSWAVPVTLVFFLVWKTPWIQPVIDFYNSVTPLPIERVVDYTDYLAFLILPLPWAIIRFPYWRHTLRLPSVNYRLGTLVAMVTCLSFMATSPPSWYRMTGSPGNVRFNDKPSKTQQSKQAVLLQLQQQGVDYLPYLVRDTIWVAPDSFLVRPLAERGCYSFVIPELVISKDTVHQVHFTLFAYDSTAVSEILFTSMTLPGVPDSLITQRTTKKYLKRLRREVKSIIKR